MSEKELEKLIKELEIVTPGVSTPVGRLPAEMYRRY